MVTRKWDVYDDEARKKCIDELITRVDELEGEAMGAIAAQDLIDIVVENVAQSIYEAGVIDARKIVETRTEDINIELGALL